MNIGDFLHLFISALKGYCHGCPFFMKKKQLCNTIRSITKHWTRNAGKSRQIARVRATRMFKIVQLSSESVEGEVKTIVQLALQIS